MPLPYKNDLSSRDKLISVINHAAISLIQTNTSRFTEDMVRERMRRVADDLIVATEEVGSERIRCPDVKRKC